MRFEMHPIKARHDLQSIYLGIPIDLALSICSSLRAYDAEIERSMFHMDAGCASLSQRHYLEPIICQLLFCIHDPALRDHDFLGFISDKPHVEASVEIVSKLTESEIRVGYSASMNMLDARWLSVKAYIDEANLALLVDEVMRELADREVQLLRLSFGLEDGRPRPAVELAKRFNLSRARIYQLKNSSLYSIRGHVDGRTRRNRKRPRPALAIWVSELLDLCVLKRVSLQAAMDYIELRNPNESRFLLAIYHTPAAIISRQIELRDSVVNSDRQKSGEDASVTLSVTQLRMINDLTVDELNLSVRTVLVLHAAGVTKATDLARLRQSELIRMPNLGLKAIKEIKAAFAALA